MQSDEPFPFDQSACGYGGAYAEAEIMIREASGPVGIMAAREARDAAWEEQNGLCGLPELEPFYPPERPSWEAWDEALAELAELIIETDGEIDHLAAQMAVRTASAKGISLRQAARLVLGIKVSDLDDDNEEDEAMWRRDGWKDFGPAGSDGGEHFEEPSESQTLERVAEARTANRTRAATQARAEEARRLRSQEMTMGAIGRSLGVSKSTVHRYLQAAFSPEDSSE